LGDDELSWDRFIAVVSDGLNAMGVDPVEGMEPEDHLVDDLGLDSFGVLVLAGELEMRLGRTLPASNGEPTLENLYRLAAATVAVGSDGHG